MIDRETLLSNDKLTLWYVPRSGLLWHEIHEWVCGAPYREMLETGLTCMKERGLTKWLSDNRNNNALPPDDERWIHHDWFPRTLEAGWTHWAVVPPVKIFGEKNMRRYANRYETFGLATKMFADPVEARAWLEQQSVRQG